MANSDPVPMVTKLATSKAPPVTNFRRGEEMIPAPDQPAAARLLWDYTDPNIKEFSIEHSVETAPGSGVFGPREVKEIAAKDKREKVCGGYVQGVTVKYWITAVKP